MLLTGFKYYVMTDLDDNLRHHILERFCRILQFSPLVVQKYNESVWAFAKLESMALLQMITC